MKPLLENASIGHGIERVIYELNPTLSCQSPLLETEYVYDLTEMLHAYERLAQQNPDGMDVLVDRILAGVRRNTFKGWVGRRNCARLRIRLTLMQLPEPILGCCPKYKARLAPYLHQTFVMSRSKCWSRRSNDFIAAVNANVFTLDFGKLPRVESSMRSSDYR